MIKKSTQHTFTKSNNTRISTSHSRCHVPLLTCTGTHTRKAECTLFNKNRFWPPQLFRSVHAHPHQIQLHLKFQAIRGKIKEEKNWSSLTGKLLSLVSPNNNNRGKNKKKSKELHYTLIIKPAFLLHGDKWSKWRVNFGETFLDVVEHFKNHPTRSPVTEAAIGLQRPVAHITGERKKRKVCTCLPFKPIKRKKERKRKKKGKKKERKQEKSLKLAVCPFSKPSLDAHVSPRRRDNTSRDAILLFL